MAVVDWKSILGWSDESIAEVRFSAFSLLREGQYTKARTFFEMLVTVDETSIYDKQILGAILLKLGEQESALEWLERALELDPFHEPTLLNKIKVLLLLGRKSDAFALLFRLERSSDPYIANDAAALRLAYS